jgi:hypothetical protein
MVLEERMIKLKDDYYLDADANSIMLKKDMHNVRTRTRPDGKQVEQSDFSVIGYYASVENALNGFVQEEVKDKIRNSNSSDFKDFLKDIKILLNDIEQMKQINI